VTQHLTFCLRCVLHCADLCIVLTVSGLALEFVDIALCMKLISFAHCCNDLRKEPNAETRAATRPTASHVLYFLMAPTLLYQTEYPRSPRIRWRFVARRFTELVVCLSLQLFLWEQYVSPLIQNALPAIDRGDVLVIAERVLKLAVPNAAIWLLMFFSVFHAVPSAHTCTHVDDRTSHDGPSPLCPVCAAAVSVPEFVGGAASFWRSSVLPCLVELC
jgi:hypothetical protein